MTGWRASLVWAILSVVAAFGWQCLTVHYNFGGNWTALFYTGSRRPIPPALDAEHLYRFANSDGWDGQFYHFAAHDPFLRTDLFRSFDFPRLRYRRILVPALAFTLAGGNSAYVDGAYRGVILLFVLAGSFWLSRLADSWDRSPAWGLAFLLAPGTIPSIDRMGVDVVLAALCLGFVLFLHRGGWLFAVLVLAGLSRDSGLLLTAGYCLFLVIHGKMSRAVLYAAAGLPALGWYLFVNARTPPYPFDGTLAVPFSGVVDRLMHPLPYPFAPGLALWMESLDFLAIGAVLLAFALAFVVGRKSRWSPQACVMVAFVVLGIAIWRPGDWLEAYDYGRILSPLLVLLAMDGLASRSWLGLAPVCLMLPRFGMQVASQVAGVAKGLLGASML